MVSEFGYCGKQYLVPKADPSALLCINEISLNTIFYLLFNFLLFIFIILLYEFNCLLFNLCFFVCMFVFACLFVFVCLKISFQVYNKKNCLSGRDHGLPGYAEFRGTQFLSQKILCQNQCCGAGSFWVRRILKSDAASAQNLMFTVDFLLNLQTVTIFYFSHAQYEDKK
jgi:hypothetical protein